MKVKPLNTRKQSGFVMTAELVLLATILVLGSIVGMVTLRDALTAEMGDVAEAIGAVDQGFEFDGMLNAQNTASVAGSAFTDAIDTNAGDDAADEFIASNGVETSANTTTDNGTDNFADVGNVADAGVQ